MTEPLTELISKLLQADSSLTWCELADALWLARFLPSTPANPLESSDPKNSKSDPTSGSTPDPSSSKNDDGAESQPVSGQLPEVPKEPEKLYPKLEPLDIDSLSSNFDQIPADTVRIAAGQALPNQRAIELALRPLKRRVPVSELELDEETTGQLNAELRRLKHFKQQVVIPMLQPVQKRWLQVALVVDNSNSMIIWQDTARELGHLLTRQGFQDVRMWHLTTQNSEPGILPFEKRQSAALSPPACKLPNINDRQLILVLTDCVGPAWQNNSAFRLLADWSDQTSVTLLQVWPEHFWPRTALGSINTLVKNKVQPTRSVKATLQIKQYEPPIQI